MGSASRINICAQIIFWDESELATDAVEMQQSLFQI